MLRRIAHVVLLFAGLAPAVWAVCIFASDPRRASVLGGLAALGLSINGTALGKRDFGMRVPLRVIACGVALVVLATVMAMWQWLRRVYLPGLPSGDSAERAVALAASANLLWIAGALGYVLITILLLPRSEKPPGRSDSGEQRIDFRRFGR
jgi:hypothetical protein